MFQIIPAKDFWSRSSHRSYGRCMEGLGRMSRVFGSQNDLQQERTEEF